MDRLCEAVDEANRGLPDHDAEAEGPEPCTWRCPTCHGPIVRVFWEETAAHESKSERPGEIADQAVVRAGYRCRSAPCGWAEWVSVGCSPPTEASEDDS